MRNAVLSCLAIAAVALAGPAPARAQALTTGAIQGVVSDAASGEPLAGVTVTASAPGRARNQTAFTGEDGRFEITELIPGTYDVTFTFDTATAVHRGVEVNVDAVTSLYQQLKIGEAIHIEGPPPPIDITSPAHRKRIGRKYLENVPVPGPTFESALGAIGGSQNDGVGVAFSGSTSLENRYLVDGVDITGLTFGDVGTPVLNEFIQEMEVVTGGYNAEYGRATGGIVNIVTRSGTDHLRGSIFGVVSPGFLAAPTYATPVQASSIDVTSGRGTQGNVGVEVGGPLVKGRAWFYLGLAPQFSSTSYVRTTKRQTDCRIRLPSGQLSSCEPGYADGIPDVDPKTGFYVTDPIDRETRAATTRSMSVLAKINLAPTARDQAQVSLIALPAESRTPGLYGLPTSGRQTRGLTTDAAARWTSKLAGGKTELEALVAWHRSTARGGSLDPALDGDPLQILEDGSLGTWSALGGESAATTKGCADGGASDPYPLITNCPMQARSYAIGGPGALQDDVEDRRAARLAVIQRAHALGSHQLKAGLDFEDDTKMLERAYSGGAVITNAIGSTVSIQRYAQLAAPGTSDPTFDQTCTTPDSGVGLGTSARTFACSFGGTRVGGQTLDWAAYLQDSWQPIASLTIDAGLRYEEQQLRYAKHLRGTTDPLTGEHIGTNAMTLRGNFAPRIGVVYDPTHQGRAKIYASWGRFFESIPMDINDRSFGGEVTDQRTFDAKDCGKSDPDLGGPDGTGCLSSTLQQNEQLIGSSGVLVAPGIRAEYMDEVLAGAELAVIPNVVAGIAVQHRRLGRVIEDVSTDGANTYLIANPGEWSAADDRAMLARIAATTDPAEHARLAHQLDLFRGIRTFDKPVRDYDAIELTLGRKFAPGLFLQASYTFSRTEGNYPGSVSYDNGQIDPNISSQYDLVELLANRRGRLPQDRPHSIKIDGYYGFGVGGGKLTIGGRFRAISGIPTNALAAHYLYGPDESFLLPRGMLGRTELDHALDLHVSYKHAFPHGVGVELYADVFNVYDRQGTFGVDDTYAPAVRPSANGAGGTPNNVNPISGGSYEDLIWAKTIDAKGTETAIPTARNPNFHQPTARYAPASAQVGFRVTF